MTREDTAAAVAHLRSMGFGVPCAAVVLGSGLSSFADGLDDRIVAPYGGIPGIPPTGVQGHAGNLVFGRLDGRQLIVCAGRVHYYEGRAHSEVVWQVRLLHEIGARVLVITNAAGGIDPGFDVGEIMLIADQISAVTGRFRPRTAGTFRMAGAYTGRLAGLARREALAAGIRLREGVYMGSPGPAYETPAEIEGARLAGAHAVGMSTVAEVQEAHLLGMEVLGLSLITNVPLPGRFAETTHTEVLEAGRAGAAGMLSLVAAIVRKL